MFYFDFDNRQLCVISDNIRMESNSHSCLFDNISFNLEVLQHLENDLELYEKVSLIFLLYDDIPVAQERLFLAIKADLESAPSQRSQMNLLHDWALKLGSFWREKLIEGLLIIKAYSNVRKLDLDLDMLKAHFLPECIHTSLFIHPMKKALFAFCESLTTRDTQDVISSLMKDCPNMTCEAMDLRYFELFLLKLLRHGYIKLGSWRIKNIPVSFDGSFVLSDVKKLASVLKELKLVKYGDILLSTQESLNGPFIASRKPTADEKHNLKEESAASSSQRNNITEDNKQYPVTTEANNIQTGENDSGNENKLKSNFTECTHTTSNETVKKSTPNSEVAIFVRKDKIYPITSYPVGVLVIINEVKFENKTYPELTRDLDDRIGSDVDVDRLKKTWESLQFKVVVYENLDSQDIKLKIRIAALTMVEPEHSVFAVCILSHGVKGGVVGSDGIQVKVETIEQLLYSSEAPVLAGKPKILLIQACQGEDKLPIYHPTNQTQHLLQHDGPISKISTVPDKSDMFVFWSTVPDFASYRDPNNGTWFIQCLCDHLEKNVDDRDFLNLCLDVNLELSQKTYGVYGQMSEFTTSFTKALFLRKK